MIERDDKIAVALKWRVNENELRSQEQKMSGCKK
jgi:hypothetical protein